MKKAIQDFLSLVARDWRHFNWFAKPNISYSETCLFITGKFFPLSLAFSIVTSAIFFSIIFLDTPFAVFAKQIDPNIRHFFGEITEIGSSEWFIIVTLTIICFTLIGMRISNSMKMKYSLALIRQWSWYFLAVIAIVGLSVNFVKYALGRARPKHFEELGVLEFDFLLFESSFASFPSGHTTTVISAAFALAIIFPKLRTILITIGCWVALSRVIIGAHYLSDILAGYLYGGVGSFIMYQYFLCQKYFKEPTKKRREIIRAAFKSCLKNR